MPDSLSFEALLENTKETWRLPELKRDAPGYKETKSDTFFSGMSHNVKDWLYDIGMILLQGLSSFSNIYLLISYILLLYHGEYMNKKICTMMLTNYLNWFSFFDDLLSISFI